MREAQSSAQEPIPEHVSTIKPNDGNGPSQVQTGNLLFSATNIDIGSLIAEGYGIALSKIEHLPGWDQQFDVRIKVVHAQAARSMDTLSRRALLKDVLQDRFHLSVHVKKEVQDVYFLRPRVNRRNVLPRHLSAAPDGESVSFSASEAGIKASSMPISVLCSHLTEILHKSVLDQSELTGRFDFESSWLPPLLEDTSARMETRSVKEALREDFGLELVRGKAPAEKLVIDHIERPDYD